MGNVKAVQIISNQSGQLTLGFLYGVTLILGASTLIIALTFALTLTEVLQYVAFAGARAYLAGDRDEQTQIESAQVKVEGDLLRTLPFLIGAISNQWIKVKPNGAKNYRDYATSGGARLENDDGLPANRIVGYQIEYEIPILGIRLPLLGDAIQPPGGGGFQTRVNAFLMREPTEEECLNFFKGAYSAFKTNSGANVVGTTTTDPILDNGC